MDSGKKKSVLTATAVATFLAGMLSVTPAASAAPGLTAGSSARGSYVNCTTHRANTVAWGDCTGVKKGWARLGAHCWSGWKWTDWESFTPGQKKTLRYECRRSVDDVKYEDRSY